MSRFKDRLAALGFATYAAYLESAHWSEFKTAYRADCAAKNIQVVCRVCSRKRIAFHHVSYLRLGAERLTDVIPLCTGHHQGVHEYLAARRMHVGHTDEAIAHILGKSVPSSLSPRKGPPEWVKQKIEKYSRKGKRKAKTEKYKESKAQGKELRLIEMIEARAAAAGVAFNARCTPQKMLDQLGPETKIPGSTAANKRKKIRKYIRSGNIHIVREMCLAILIVQANKTHTTHVTV